MRVVVCVWHVLLFVGGCVLCLVLCVVFRWYCSVFILVVSCCCLGLTVVVVASVVVHCMLLFMCEV